MKQRGATLHSVIVIIFLVCFFTTLIFKIGPITLIIELSAVPLVRLVNLV